MHTLHAYDDEKGDDVTMKTMGVSDAADRKSKRRDEDGGEEMEEEETVC